MKPRHWIGATLAPALFLAGCAPVGPNYKRPTVPVPTAYKEPPPPAFKEAEGWKLAAPQDGQSRTRWWEIFEDPQLNELAAQIDAGNVNLRIAEARFREARTQIQFNRAAKYPTISVGPGIGGLRNSAHRPGFPVNATAIDSGNFNLPFDFSYEVDFWGRVRRSIEAARDAAQASAADLETARLSIQAELAYNYFELRSIDALTAVLEQTVKNFSEAVDLTRSRFEGGVSPKTDLAQATTQLEAARAQLTDAGVARAQYEHAIAVLLGKSPSEFSLPRRDRALTPPRIPVGLPAELLERRPDVAAIERRVAEANEQIGIAKAAFYPTVRLGLTLGLQGTSLLNLFNWPSRFWSAGPTATQVLYDAGRRKATSEATLARYDQLAANYRQTTLTAFQQVEDNLAALRILETEEGQQRRAIESARESLQLATNRYQGGVDTYLQVLTAQSITLTNERAGVDIRRRRMAASVLLIKALGGGWDASQLPKVSD